MVQTRKVFTIFKPEGITPLESLNIFRKENPLYKGKKLGYAGTLDPLAEGLLLVLVEDENKKRSSYINLSKKYIFSFVLGFETDTYDILGISSKKNPPQKIDEKIIQETLASLKGELMQKYPPFSSKRVKGRALFEWARKGDLKNIKIPAEKRHVYDIGVQEIIPVNGNQLLKIITEKISKVSGDFRQKRALKVWQKLLSEEKRKTFFIVSASAHVSSGTYIRGLVFDVGQILSSGATVLSITRTHIGRRSIHKTIFLKGE